MTTPLKGIRRTAARRMVAAWEAPVFHLTIEIDMTEASKVKQVVPEATVTDVLVAAAAQALIAVPALNSYVGDDEVTVFSEANVGVAVATDKGLTVPVIHGADRLTMTEIAARRREAVDRARTGTLVRDDITGGTFTISNLGMMGIDRFDAILNIPQSAILAVGATKKRHVWTEAGGEWLPIAEFTLTCDHRSVDGATGATFLKAFSDALTTPIAV
ncbi:MULTISPECIES: 2-oxo acid dehydrogenase subunit E2 [Cryobacterium]|uniref:2-oxo acid dehydrogenase subunit E2 n=1 Tax=Cryobacterium TaxID=69578 RepID=UPI0018E08EC8|nr:MULTISPECIES: 2-oxo acid dehydrogenase subunit E2 [Cryobacterium]